MTGDRKKAVLYLTITFIIGILIGSLIPALFGRFSNRDPRGQGRGPGGNKQEWLTKTIIRVVKPDSAQVKEIRPLTKEAMEKIGELEKGSNERMSSIMDSLKLKLRPILTEDQNRQLEEFSAKARQRWRNRK